MITCRVKLHWRRWSLWLGSLRTCRACKIGQRSLTWKMQSRESTPCTTFRRLPPRLPARARVLFGVTSLPCVIRVSSALFSFMLRTIFLDPTRPMFSPHDITVGVHVHNELSALVGVHGKFRPLELLRVFECPRRTPLAPYS